MNDEDKTYITKELADAARLISRGVAKLLDLKRKYNGRREPKKEDKEDGDE